MSTGELNLKGIKKTLGNFSLNQIDLTISENTYLVILGPSGCGKTSLLECIAGIKSPDDGVLMLNGEDITHTAIEKRGMGFVYQNLMLFPHLNVIENLLYGLKIRKLDDAVERAKEALIALGIDHLAERPIENLSGGEKQRVALARALVIRPKVLLLDEPLSALDPRTKNHSMALLKKIHEEFVTTTIHVTHDHAEARFLADQIAVMNEGKIVQVDKVDKIFHKPTSKFIAEFVCAENIFEGQAQVSDQGTSVCIADNGQQVELWAAEQKEGNVNLMIHPGNIVVSKQKIQTSMRNDLKGSVVSVADLHHLIQLTVDVGIPFRVNLTKQAYQEMQIALGSNLHISFKASAIHLF